MRVRSLLVVALLACAGPAEVAAPVQVVLPEDDAALRREGQALVDVITPALAACAPLFDGAAPPALTVDLPGLEAACGPLRDLYAAQVDRVGRSRTLDVLLNDLARVGDDLDFFARSMEGDGGRELALHHVQEGIARAGQTVAGFPMARVVAYSAGGGRSQWALDLQNDAQDAPNLQGHLDRYAFQQGIDPRYVRRRMLDGFGRMIAAPFAPRRAAVSSMPPTDDTMAALVYLDAYAIWQGTYARVTRAYVAGEITDEAARARVMAEAEEGFQAWKRAWEIEVARVGKP